MKTIILSFFTFFSTFHFAQEKEGILGDFNGDGKSEYAYTKVNDCSDECDGKCETVIYFSDKNIKPFTISPAKNGTLYNLKDLNNDGKDDIGFYPDWCTSCWHPLYVYTLKKDKWEPLVSPISTHCSQWEDEKFPIKKDPKKKGYVIIMTSVWKDDDIKIISKSVKIN
ncbi:hypothetical protein [Chryseobacterium sp. MMS23-Vi53]|uniref:hypothetical protein n=1 Tax=Chryseobacterium sp. MMS23-Vi53 TaxID=3386644 RepID=UPI0039E9AE02